MDAVIVTVSPESTSEKVPVLDAGDPSLALTELLSRAHRGIGIGYRPAQVSHRRQSRSRFGHDLAVADDGNVVVRASMATPVPISKPRKID